MPETKKRESLCVDAVNGPNIFLGTTWTGKILTFALTPLVCWAFGYKAAIITAIVCWMTPPMVDRYQPHLFKVVVRSLFFGEFHDAD